MTKSNLATWLKRRLGLSATVVVSAAFLAGCQTTTQVPVRCSTPELIKRDPKCAQPVKAKVVVAPKVVPRAVVVKKKPSTDYMILP